VNTALIHALACVRALVVAKLTHETVKPSGRYRAALESVVQAIDGLKTFH
jgi:hypothetical protein